jgi:hypothetical protein
VTALGRVEVCGLLDSEMTTLSVNPKHNFPAKDHPPLAHEAPLSLNAFTWLLLISPPFTIPSGLPSLFPSLLHRVGAFYIVFEATSQARHSSNSTSALSYQAVTPSLKSA